jgi:hypothetical protein
MSSRVKSEDLYHFIQSIKYINVMMNYEEVPTNYEHDHDDDDDNEYQSS